MIEKIVTFFVSLWVIFWVSAIMAIVLGLAILIWKHI